MVLNHTARFFSATRRESHGAKGPIRRRIGEIEKQALSSRPRTIFDAPRREFLRKYFNVPLENVRKFPAWREYLYLNVLGFPPVPVYIENRPAEIPQPKAG
jgi:hypothetical protein